MNEGVGLYVSFNSGGREGQRPALRWSLFEEFADRYFPGHGCRMVRSMRKRPPNMPRMMAGNWQVSRTAFSYPIAILQLISQTKVASGRKANC